MTYARVATANLLHGRSLDDGLVQPDRMAQAIVDLEADVVGIQEVDRNQLRSQSFDQTAFIAAAMQQQHPRISYRFVPAIIGEPGATWTAATGTADVSGHDIECASTTNSYGIGLLTRYEVEAWHTVILKAAPVKSPILMPGTKTPMLLADEPRVVVAAVLRADQAPFRTVATTHLSFVPGWNIRQFRKTLAALAQLPGPRLLLGDLNMPAAIVGKASRWHRLASAPTFPSTEPKIQFDHILTDDASLVGRSQGRSVKMVISDHQALVVDIT
jgi:endonuclease/exonuclease/phosphatase family metal-dependent hydrolase